MSVRGRQRVLQLRLTDGEFAVLDRVARSQHLKPSTWARQQLLWILEVRECSADAASRG